MIRELKGQRQNWKQDEWFKFQFPKEVTKLKGGQLCQTDGTHQIIMSTSMPFFTKKGLTKGGVMGTSLMPN